MPPVEFEPTISAGERPKTYALDCPAIGTDIVSYNEQKYEEHVLYQQGSERIEKIYSNENWRI